MVEIKNLTKYYGSNPAVQDISFTVGDHEVLGFLGPNGAGKSTTMNMITGCLPSTSGTVLVDGYDIAKDLTNGSKITIIDLGTVSVSLCVFVPQHMPVNGTDAGVGIR